ncbi:MAG: hypothetical protein LBL01_04005 [Bifidobacteriaceae bacterium]|jgi:hypothetical protein|nr:hypothetical protein [Bifidobacteriaceae bacterium]
MVTVTVRNVPDEVHDSLAAKAARKGQSLQQYMLEMMADESTRRSQEEILDEIRARARGFSTMDAEALVADIRAGRR